MTTNKRITLSLILIVLSQSVVSGFNLNPDNILFIIAVSILSFTCLICWTSHLAGTALRPPLLLAIAAATWLLITQYHSQIQENSIIFTWHWFSALAIGLSVICIVRSGGARAGIWVMGALLSAPLLRSMISSYEYGYEAWPTGYTYDPNISADVILVAVLIAAALLMPIRSRASTGQYLALGALFVISSAIMHWLLAARITLLIAGITWIVLMWPTRNWLLRLAPVLLLVVAGGQLVTVLSDTQIVSGVSTSGNLGARLSMSTIALQLFAEHPITGTGLHTFVVLLLGRRSPDMDPFIGGVVHNDWVQLLMETGVPLVLGLLAFGILCGYRWLQCLARLMAGERTTGLRLAFGCLTSVGVIFTHAATNFPFYETASLILTLGAGCCGLTLTHQRPLGDIWSGRTMRHVLLVASLIMCLCLAWSFARLAVQGAGEVVIGRALIWPKQHLGQDMLSPATQYAAIKFLQPIIPYWATGWYVRGGIAANLVGVQMQTDIDKPLLPLAASAYTSLLAAERINPYEEAPYVAQIRLLDFMEMPAEEALGVLARANKHLPFNVSLRLLAAEYLSERGRHREAEQQVLEWLPICGPGSAFHPGKSTRFLNMLPDSLTAAQTEMVHKCQRIINSAAFLNLAGSHATGRYNNIPFYVTVLLAGCRQDMRNPAILYPQRTIAALHTPVPETARQEIKDCQRKLPHVLLAMVDAWQRTSREQKADEVLGHWLGKCPDATRIYPRIARIMFGLVPAHMHAARKQASLSCQQALDQVSATSQQSDGNR